MGADIITKWVLKDEVTAVAGKIKKNVADAGKTVKDSVFTGVGLGMGISLWGAVGDAVQMAVGKMEQAVRAAAEDEASQGRLYTALEQNVRGWDGNRQAIEDALRANIKYAFTVDEQRDSLALLVARTGNLTEALDIQAGAMDLARLKGISLAAASTAIAQGMSGESDTLRSLGIEIDKNADKMEILAAVRKKAGGQRDTYAASALGTFESLNITLDQLVEDIGRELLPVMVDLANFMKDEVIPTVSGNIDTWKHLSWAMEEQRRKTDDLMFWQRGLLGLWTDSQFSAEAYAAALEEEAEQKRLNAVWTARLTGQSEKLAGALDDTGQAAEDSAKEFADLERRAKSLWDEFIEGTRAATRDEQLELEKLPAQIREAQRDVRAAQKELEGARTQAQKDEAQIRLVEAKQEVNRLQESLSELKGKFAATGKELGYSLGSNLRAEVRRWVNLTINQVRRLDGISYIGPGTNSAGPEYRAGGGPVTRGEAYVVGEEGPEIFVPRASGTILPNSEVMAVPTPAAVNVAAAAAPNVAVAVYLDSDQIAARVERRQYFAASVAPASAR